MRLEHNIGLLRNHYWGQGVGRDDFRFATAKSGYPLKLENFKKVHNMQYLKCDFFVLIIKYCMHTIYQKNLAKNGYTTLSFSQI